MAGPTVAFAGPGNHASRPAANSGAVLYTCTDHGLVYRSDGSSWATWLTLPSAGLSDPMTTRGDIIVRNASNVTARLGRGSAGYVLTSDGTDVAWAAPAGAADILDLPTAETDDTLVLSPDGAGGVEFRAETGGGGGTLPSIVQVAVDSDGSGAPSVTLAATPDQANLLVAIGAHNGSGPGSISQTNVTWTQRSQVNVGGVGNLIVWTGVWDGSGTIGTTVSWSGGGLSNGFVAEIANATCSGVDTGKIEGASLTGNKKTAALPTTPVGRIVCFVVHTGGSAASAPAMLTCPYIGHIYAAAQELCIGITTIEAPVQGIYEGGGSPAYTLLTLTP